MSGCRYILGVGQTKPPFNGIGVIGTTIGDDNATRAGRVRPSIRTTRAIPSSQG
jgi:hypothetical protein